MSSTQDIERFRARMATGEPVRAGDEIFALIHAFAQDALRVCAEINGSYHEPAELRRLFSRLIGADVPDDFTLFPPSPPTVERTSGWAGECSSTRDAGSRTREESASATGA